MSGLSRRLGLLVACSGLSLVLMAGCIVVPEPENSSLPAENGELLPTETATPTPNPTTTPTPTPPWYEGDYHPYGTASPGPTASATPVDGPVPKMYVLRYTLVADDNATRSARPGGHCDSVWINGDTARLIEGDYASFRNASAIVLVFPSLDGKWSTIGTGSKVYALAYVVNPYVEGYSGALPQISWDGANASVDAVQVSLPYDWTFQSDDGGWHIDATLSEGPTRMETRPSYTCQ